MPARTQKSVPAASPGLPASEPDVFWLRMALYIALCIWDPELWMFAFMLLGIVTIPGKALDRLNPKRLIPKQLIPHQLIPKPLWRQPTMIQTDSGDTWITHVPSIQTDSGDTWFTHVPSIQPVRVMSGLIALFFMLLEMEMDDMVPPLVRITFSLCGMLFGGIALVPDGDLRRILPRLSTVPRLPAPGGDADAGERVGQISELTVRD